MNYSQPHQSDLTCSGTSITADLTMEYDDVKHRTRTLPVRLSYTPDDAFAVGLTLFASRGEITWTFARELLTLGTTEPVGLGDVHVWPCLDEKGHAVVIIELSSPDGELALQARTIEVQRFVDQSLALVPTGTEAHHVDLDSLVGQLLQQA